MSLASLAVVVALSASSADPGAAPDPHALLARYDAVMSPAFFEVDARMIAHRADGTTRGYKMHVQKAGADKLRASFLEPATAKGQEMLRNGDNLWLYMPNLKRAVRVAARDQFMGGDFNNADVLRPNYEADYDGTITPDPAHADAVLLTLKAKGPQVAYDVVKLWMTSGKDAQPVRMEAYASSGKLLRSAEFTEVKDVGKGWRRPTKLVMKNELQPARFSTLSWDAGAVKDAVPASRFVVDDLGR